MKKIVIAVMLVLLTALFVNAQDSDSKMYDFTAAYSEDAADMLGVKVKDGFHVSVLNGSLSTVSTFGIPVTFVVENDELSEYDYGVFVLKCGYINENSKLTVSFVTSDGEKHKTDLEIPDTDYNLYSVKLPDTSISAFEIFVDSIHPSADMYSVDLDFISFEKTQNLVLLTIDKDRAFKGAEEKKLDSPALIKNDFTLTPARFVAESLGAKVEWIGEQRKVVITKGDIVIELVIDNKEAKVNGETVMLDVAPCIINDFTYTPARFVAENLQSNVRWQPSSRTVIVTD